MALIAYDDITLHLMISAALMASDGLWWPLMTSDDLCGICGI
jgi:hypothetical protein